MQRKQGFTLIELLVVIAIIAVLASIIITGLASSQANARGKSVQQSLVSARSAILLCLQTGGSMDTTPEAGTALCDPADDSQVWPPLPTAGEWMYVTDENDPVVVGLASSHNLTIVNPTSNTDEGSFNFTAYSAADDRIVSCNETGCVIE